MVLTSVGYSQEAFYGRVGLAGIWGIDVNTGVNRLLTTTSFSGGAHVNALAYDEGVDRLIYMRDTGIPGLQTVQTMGYYDFALNQNFFLTPASGTTAVRQASNGTFHNGQYWYVESNTDDLYSMNINYGAGTYSNKVFRGSVVDNGHPLDFGDIVFDTSGNLLLSAGHTISNPGTNGTRLRLFNVTTQNDSIRGQYLGQIARLDSTYYGTDNGVFFKFNPANAAILPGYSFAILDSASDLAVRRIPEPSTTGLLALAGSLCLIRRRRA